MIILSWVRSAVFSIIVFPILTVFCSVWGVLWYVITGNRRGVEWAAHFWARVTLICLNVQLVIKGEENLPQSGALILFNHSSFMDIFSLVATVKKIKFGAKIELFRIPVFSLAMRAYGNLPIPRRQREQAIQVLHEAEDRGRRGEKFALAPEGKRNTEEKLLPFKSGPFIFAINAQIPIVPVIIKGACAAWPKRALVPCSTKWKHKIHLEFLPQISVSDYDVSHRKNLSEKTREVMLKYF